MIANEYFATVPIEILYNSLRVTKHLRMLMKAVWWPLVVLWPILKVI